MNDNTISTMVRGVSTNLPDLTRDALEQSIRTLSSDLEKATTNRISGQLLSKPKPTGTGGAKPVSDTEMFTTISEMINGNTKDVAGFGTLLDSLYDKNRKYFTIIKDYEIMPILIPQINRVLSFLVNECLSPDIQNEQTFSLKYTGPSGTSVQADLDRIKKEMELDNILRDVYTNRYKLGHEYYIVQDYQATFQHMKEKLQQRKVLGETANIPRDQVFSDIYKSLIGSVNEAAVSIPVTVVKEDPPSPGKRAKDADPLYISESAIDISLSKLNIVVERSSIVRLMEDTEAMVIQESYRRYSSKTLINGGVTALNEATTVIDNDKFYMLVNSLQNKKLQRCTITRLDPAKVFKLKVGGKTIGYFYVTDINENTNGTINFSQSLKDQLLKSRATSLSNATKTAEEVISKEIAVRILNTFDPSLGISRVEDIDLMHDFILNNEIYKGNKRVTFYYEDEIFDLSRSDGSILINAVFFTKLYATLLLNNIITKVLRGRGRQIHTVQLGVSSNMRRYIDNAMASLVMPEHNLGVMHGTFEHIMNPFSGSSDIVLPTEDDEKKYITTDYIPGQDVDMDDNFLKFLLSSIVSSFNLDSAVLDATNGQLQFARTLTMESLQISTSIKNEQQDTYDHWKNLCYEVIRILGTTETQSALNNGQIEVKFFEPKSLIIQNAIEDMNNVKNFAESIAEIIPEFNEDGGDKIRAKWVYGFIKDQCNLDTGLIDRLLADAKIDIVVKDDLEAKIRQIVQEMIQNTREEQFGDTDGDGLDDTNNPEYRDSGESNLTPEEQDIMNTPTSGDDDLM